MIELHSLYKSKSRFASMSKVTASTLTTQAVACSRRNKIVNAGQEVAVIILTETAAGIVTDSSTLHRFSLYFHKLLDDHYG